MAGTTTPLSFAQIEQLWTQSGGDPNVAPVAAAIALAESGGNPGALNNDPATGDYSVGLWQINYYGNLYPSRTAAYGSPATLRTNPSEQAAAAIGISGNGQNWSPWTTYTSGAYKQYLMGAPAQTTGIAAPPPTTSAGPSKPGSGVNPYIGQLAQSMQTAYGSGAYLTNIHTHAPAPVTPSSTAPGVPATPPAPPSLGWNPVSDLGSIIAWTTEFAAWGVFTSLVFLLGAVLLLLGVVLLGLVFVAPLTDPITTGIGKVSPSGWLVGLAKSSRQQAASESRQQLAQSRGQLAQQREQRGWAELASRHQARTRAAENASSRESRLRYDSGTRRQHEQRMFGEKATARGPRRPRTPGASSARAHARIRGSLDAPPGG